MPFRIFCYINIAFGLKNGGATYQKCVHTVLEGQIGRNVEAYIDDIVVKSEKHADLLDDLKETFDNLRKFKMSVYLVCHQVNYWAICYHLGGLTRTQRRWKPSKNCKHLGLEKKYRS
jgi:hypothetical protein